VRVQVRALAFVVDNDVLLMLMPHAAAVELTKRGKMRLLLAASAWCKIRILSTAVYRLLMWLLNRAHTDVQRETCSDVWRLSHMRMR
jgi:hypothetical protein